MELFGAFRFLTEPHALRRGFVLFQIDRHIIFEYLSYDWYRGMSFAAMQSHIALVCRLNGLQTNALLLGCEVTPDVFVCVFMHRWKRSIICSSATWWLSVIWVDTLYRPDRWHQSSLQNSNLWSESVSCVFKNLKIRSRSSTLSVICMVFLELYMLFICAIMSVF